MRRLSTNECVIGRDYGREGRQARHGEQEQNDGLNQMSAHQLLTGGEDLEYEESEKHRLCTEQERDANDEVVSNYTNGRHDRPLSRVCSRPEPGCVAYCEISLARPCLDG